MFDPSLAAFLEGDSAQYVGTADADRVPAAGRSWGLRVDRARGRVRALIGADSNTVQNLERTRRVALTVTDVATYRSIQLKGTVVEVEPATSSDRDVHERYRREFQAAVVAIGATTPFERVWPAELVAVTVEVDELFDQTPGPGAGRPVGSDAP